MKQILLIIILVVILISFCFFLIKLFESQFNRKQLIYFYHRSIEADGVLYYLTFGLANHESFDEKDHYMIDNFCKSLGITTYINISSHEITKAQYTQIRTLLHLQLGHFYA